MTLAGAGNATREREKKKKKETQRFLTAGGLRGGVLSACRQKSSHK